MDQWRNQALCAQIGSHLWFPEKGHVDHTRAAKRICAKCRVRDTCLDFAMSLDEPPSGVWGGLTERERRVLRTAS